MRKIPLFAISMAGLLFAVGCTIVDASHIVTGTTHPATSPSQIKLYGEAPKVPYEVIGVVNVTANNDWVAGQELLDDALTALKDEAAKLGANALLIDGINAHMSANDGLIVGSNDNLNWLFTDNTFEKSVQAKALYILPAQ
ncbi:DUF4156 domain-containing protein [Shewanella sp. C32]|uniref:DUF4156 domain-containing protein n=1 Tax=Shewanella electrica TaxID=515560 RepID=A0ABT2FQP9_9GAMM|nr:DUF4156 domain-containing protein [Shewanella electrica]MCH1927075.1 DUF4156 domain-containing protein [Shewanella electrica]MCS4558674.1 DUF4156 domain-containing protein [Shewanella electrica]